VAHPLNGLANLYYKQGKYEQAKLLYEHVLEMRQRLLEPQHPDTVETQKWYATLLRAMNRPEKAAFLEAPPSVQGKAEEERETPQREH
jgi:tetratricopeptide (TPR) repeat protein